jgi:hypothetical protein
MVPDKEDGSELRPDIKAEIELKFGEYLQELSKRRKKPLSIALHDPKSNFLEFLMFSSIDILQCGMEFLCKDLCMWEVNDMRFSIMKTLRQEFRNRLINSMQYKVDRDMEDKEARYAHVKFDKLYNPIMNILDQKQMLEQLLKDREKESKTIN